MPCLKCGGTNTVRNGKTNYGPISFWCRDCNKYFLLDSDEEEERYKYKKCDRCGKVKHISEFNRTEKQKEIGFCRDCHREICTSKPFKTYGILPEDFVKILQDQDNKCAICGDSFNNERTCVDHDHSNMLIRGILCNRCNLLLGLARNSINTLKSAIEYLSKEHGIYGKVNPHVSYKKGKNGKKILAK